MIPLRQLALYRTLAVALKIKGSSHSKMSHPWNILLSGAGSIERLCPPTLRYTPSSPGTLEPPQKIERCGNAAVVSLPLLCAFLLPFLPLSYPRPDFFCIVNLTLVDLSAETLSSSLAYDRHHPYRSQPSASCGRATKTTRKSGPTLVHSEGLSLYISDFPCRFAIRRLTTHLSVTSPFSIVPAISSMIGDQPEDFPYLGLTGLPPLASAVCTVQPDSMDGAVPWGEWIVSSVLGEDQSLILSMFKNFPLSKLLN